MRLLLRYISFAIRLHKINKAKRRTQNEEILKIKEIPRKKKQWSTD